MDELSAQLMEDIVLEPRNKTSNEVSKKTSATSTSKSINVATNPKRGRLKVELQTLRISEESERQLFNTLKHVYGPSFKLNDVSNFEDNKKSKLDGQYWMERGDLVIRGVVDYSSKNPTPKGNAALTQRFASSKLESYSFHPNHCLEALSHAEGDFGRALEILFEKYYQVKPVNTGDADGFSEEDLNDILEKRDDEKQALESIYSEMFVEKIKNRLWLVKLKLDYLLRKKSDDSDDKTAKKNDRKNNNSNNSKRNDVCRLFVSGKCRFADRCKFLHQQPEQKKIETAVKEDSEFILEIRFPEGNKYPYEPPYLYLYKSDPSMAYPNVKYLMIVKRLYEEAKEQCTGESCLFTLISLLENEDEMMEYLNNNNPNFIDMYDSLFTELPDDETGLSTHHQKGTVSKQSKNKLSEEEVVEQDNTICKRFMNKNKNQRFRKIIESRQKLPAWNMMTDVIETVDNNQVTIISGETGCGKSTQVPQFMLDDWIVNRRDSKSHAEIICTQPRRISAIGVAERVAFERDEKIGNTVGYQIRLESKISSWTRLTFCTTGILLQRMSSDPTLKSVTHVIVDEVHERSAESDFLLMLLRQILPKRPDLKIILMSATLKAETFSSYFNGTPILEIPGRTFPVEQIFLEDVLDRCDFVLEENSKYTRKIRGGWEDLEMELETADVDALAGNPPQNSIADENLRLSQLVGRYPGYSNQVYKNLYVMDHDKINYDLIEKVLEWIVDGDHDYPRKGSILVFLPGIAEISATKDVITDNKILSPRSGNFVVVPLHSMLTSEEQAMVFQKPKNGARKIVLSTNIAETSVTIDDCVFVVDTGKMKETRFNSNTNMASLEACWVSRANAMQRKGRAGRVMSGVCIHLYTSNRFAYRFLGQPIPEIQRIPLEPLLLRIQIMNGGKHVNLFNVMEKIIEPPAEQSVRDAITRLQDVGAFDSQCNLTPLGHHLAALPVDVRIGKLILYGAIFCCVDSALTIAACLSHKSPFTTPFDKRQSVDAKKKEFTTAYSDQLTILKAYKKWLDISSRGYHAGQVFAYENFLSVRTLQTLADVKHQLLELLVSIGFAPIDIKKRQPGVDKVIEMSGSELNGNNENLKLLQGLLCAALYPNTVKIFTPEKSFQMRSAGAIPTQPKPEELKFQTKDDGFVHIHPSSVNFSVGHFPSPYLVYQEKIKTSKVFIKEISVVSMLPLVLFSGYGISIEQHNGEFILSLADGWILFAVESHKVAQLLQHMRIELVKLLEQKMQDPLLNLLHHQNGRRIIDTIITILTKD
ncbi:putative ATP-dependent RNA helicase DHX57 [Microplitis demolitor]|uniref:putative ATP-dependent RNA helicase DHX57 n=1 Tax=Microplitis demolitor TaxID=69319 RepID=UPI0004CCE08F|nr:putative ATP-dependent RNA helicase DHX57 [Microplitis demolitor]